AARTRHSMVWRTAARPCRPAGAFAGSATGSRGTAPYASHTASGMGFFEGVFELLMAPSFLLGDRSIFASPYLELHKTPCRPLGERRNSKSGGLAPERRRLSGPRRREETRACRRDPGALYSEEFSTLMFGSAARMASADSVTTWIGRLKAG